MQKNKTPREFLFFQKKLSKQLFIACLLCCLSLFFLLWHKSLLLHKLRSQLFNPIILTLNTLSKPINLLKSKFDNLLEFIDLYHKLDLYKKENERLAQWKNEALSLAMENELLRKHINLVNEVKPPKITARIIGGLGGSYAHNVIINAGSKHNIHKNQPITINKNLVGRVIEVGEESSRILLINDSSSRIPIILTQTNTLGIVSGNNAPYLSLLHVKNYQNIHIGEKITTSGHGGIFPAGLLIGEIYSIEGKEVKIKPFIDINRLKFVQISNHESKYDF